MSHPSRLLFIDAYDSFSNNIIALLEESCGVQVTKLNIDTVVPNLVSFLTGFDAVICGPGPGHPGHLRDIGLFEEIWNLSDENLIPVLGICLGFQSLAYHFGAFINRLPQPRHGINTCVVSGTSSIFEGLSKINTVQYHSLYVSLRLTQDEGQRDSILWEPSECCPELQPLAWEFQSAGVDENSKLCSNPPAILMAVKHVRKPFYGIQFHPESICSEPLARRTVINWWQASIAWLSANPRPSLDSVFTDGQHRCINGLEDSDDGHLDSLETPSCSPKLMGSQCSSSFSSATSQTSKSSISVASASLCADNMTIPSICTALDLPKHEIIILDSEMRQLPQLGETSIIGLIFPNTIKIKYTVGTNWLSLCRGNSQEKISLETYNNDIFLFIKAFLSDYEIDDNLGRTFCGGLMGYISYEACLETIGVAAASASQGSDICFAFIERSILMDHKNHMVYIQSLHSEETRCEIHQWLNETVQLLDHLSEHGKSDAVSSRSYRDCVLHQDFPKEAEYRTKILQCQDSINAGDAYELCLTGQSSISLTSTVSPWELYCSLRQMNPAPFAAYVRLDALTLLSTSPERFMKWSREEESSNVEHGEEKHSITCQFRPIKGTVQKHQTNPDGSSYSISREKATAILGTQKEKAENLMIVDLIRHDLHGVCSIVSVKDLMIVEEYESIFQLVSVIEGRLRPDLTGVDCLAVSLPPGSMTGAPKRRACQLLRDVEETKPRSIYSGVLGYMCVSGKGDFSVVIRSIYKWDESESETPTWNIGAGGAITTLSTEDGEWEEMLTKLRSTYRLFS